MRKGGEAGGSECLTSSSLFTDLILSLSLIGVAECSSFDERSGKGSLMTTLAARRVLIDCLKGSRLLLLSSGCSVRLLRFKVPRSDWTTLIKSPDVCFTGRLARTCETLRFCEGLLTMVTSFCKIYFPGIRRVTGAITFYCASLLVCNDAQLYGAFTRVIG